MHPPETSTGRTEAACTAASSENADMRKTSIAILLKGKDDSIEFESLEFQNHIV